MSANETVLSSSTLPSRPQTRHAVEGCDGAEGSRGVDAHARKLKNLFGSKKPGGAATRMKRVNIDRRFTLVSLTGQGSMSRVHKAVDNETGRSICLKVQHFEKQAAANARSSANARPPEG